MRLSLKHSPTLARFLLSTSRVRMVLGPVGSGKTVFCCFDPYAWCTGIPELGIEGQEPGEGNVRYFKLAIVRNSMPELWRTTIETFLAMWADKPEFREAKFRRSSPINWTIKLPPKNGKPGIDYQVDFFALDRPEQVKSLLSYEATAIYFNEVREIAKAIVDAAGDRIGRYPSKAKGGVMPSRSFIIGDSNPPDEDHWLYEAYADPPKGWEFFMQPPGVSQVILDGNHFIAAPGEPDVGRVTPDMVVEGAQGKLYAVNPKAENLPNLPLDRTFDPSIPRDDDKIEWKHIIGPGNYYLTRIPGKSQAWIDGYYRNKFVYVQDGKPVIPEFQPHLMAVNDLKPLKGVPFGGGFDVGGGTLQPAGLICQRHPLGTYLIHAELSIDDIGIEQFGTLFKRLLIEDFGVFEDEKTLVTDKLKAMYGDPSGKNRDEIFSVAVFDHLRSKGIPAKEAPTNDPEIRVEAVKMPMLRLISGRPGILINRRRCPKLVKGLSGAWSFRRLKVAGSEKYAIQPDKSAYSHVCDALGYYLCGEGEFKTLRGRDAKNKDHGKPVNDEYDYFGD